MIKLELVDSWKPVGKIAHGVASRTDLLVHHVATPVQRFKLRLTLVAVQLGVVMC